MKKKQKFLVLLLVVILALPMFAGCGRGGDDDEPHIVFVTPLIAHPVWLISKEGFEEAAEDLGFRGDWVGPSGIDVDEMIRQIEIAIMEEADGIITQGINPEAMVPVLQQAYDAGIPVVVVNSDIPDAPRLAYLGTDPETVGRMGAEAIIEKLDGEAPVVAYMIPTVENTISVQMIEAYRSVLSQVPGYVEVATVESRSDMLTAVQRWEEVFLTHPDVNVVVGACGSMGPSAALVVREQGLEDQVIIMAIDDVDEIVEGIREGIIYATMTQNFYRKGYQAAMWILDYLRDGTRPAHMINDSGTMVVTLDNIDTYQVDMTVVETWN